MGRTREQFGHWAVALNTGSLDDEGSADADVEHTSGSDSSLLKIRSAGL